MADAIKPAITVATRVQGDGGTHSKSIATPAGGGAPGGQLRSIGPATRVDGNGTLLNAPQVKKDGTPLQPDGVKLSELGQKMGQNPEPVRDPFPSDIPGAPQGRYIATFLSDGDDNVHVTIDQNGQVMMQDADGEPRYLGQLGPDDTFAVSGLGGDDRITVDNQSSANIIVQGGDGDDLISNNGSSGGYVYLGGGAGHDTQVFNGDSWYRPGGSPANLQDFEEHLPLPSPF